jgi:glycosyltransferase involved in cell wall biosynthesis
VLDLKGFDIIHAHNLRHPHVELSLWVSKLRGIPLVLTPHSPYHVGARGPILDAAARAYDYLQGMHPLPHIDRIIALHEAEKEWLLERGVRREKIIVVPNGIEERFFSKIKKAAGRKEVIFIGRLSQSKGLDLLLKSFSQINAKGWKSRLVGPDGGIQWELIALAKKLGISEKVIFQGEVTGRMLLSLLDNAGMFVLPSKYEPFGISLVEAMARGKACIAIDSGGPREIISNGKDGLLVEYDEGKLAEGIDRLAMDAALRERLGANAKETAKKYRWGEIARRIEMEYEKLVAAK